MSKILKLKEWLSLEDAAAHLSLIAETEVKPQDLVQFAIDGRIGLSLYLFTSIPACRASLVKTSDVLKWRVVDDFPSIEDLKKNGSAIIDPTPTLIQTHTDKSGTLSGLVDIYQHKAYSTYEALYGLMDVNKSDGLTVMFHVEQNEKLYILLSDNWGVDADPSFRSDHTRIPEGAKLVIRVTELSRLEAELIGKPLEPKERLGLLNIIAAMADMMLTKGTFSSQQNLSVMLAEDYEGVGISSSNIDKKIAEGKKSLQRVK